MPQSNINLMYESIIADLAERAKLIMDEYEGTDDESETDAVIQAINEGLFYTSDQAYVIAHAFCNGLIDWCGEPKWDEIQEDLFQDITDELERLRGQD